MLRICHSNVQQRGVTCTLLVDTVFWGTMRKLLIAFAALAFSGSAFAASPPPAPVTDWTGFYIGGDLGVSALHTSAAANQLTLFGAVPSPLAPISASNNASDFLGSLHAGYNYQIAQFWVAGIEGDWSWTKPQGTFSQPWYLITGLPNGSGVTTMSTTLDWLSSLRGRLGYLVSPNVLTYATGGVAWGRFGYTASAINNTYVTSFASSTTSTGYVVGGGLEWAYTKNWLVRAEYLYYGFRNGPNVLAQAAGFAPYPMNFSWSAANISVVRVGLTYKF